MIIAVDLTYNIAPALKDGHGEPLPFLSFDRIWTLTSIIGVGGVFFWAYLKSFPKAKLIPIRDPRINECLTHHECFAIFALIVFVAYLPKRPTPLADGVRTPEQRKSALVELRAKEKAATTTYGWVDQANGLVRIPTSEAVKLTIKEINDKK
jgi:hypothetical protein